MYPESVEESELFTIPKRLRGYSLTLTNIRSSAIDKDTNVVFGLLRESDQSEYMAVWSTPLGRILFGPSHFSISSCGTTEQNARYRLDFQNQSVRQDDYHIIVHSVKLLGVPSGQYSIL